MDFINHQKKARSKSKRLLWIFPFAALLVSSGIWALFAFVIWFLLLGDRSSESVEPLGYFDVFFTLPLLVSFMGGTLFIILISSIRKMVQLRGGGLKVALELGAVPLLAETATAQEKQCLNVVEEMSIASGMPIPLTCVIESPSMNAFAAGTTPDNAVVAVTRGLLDELSRDELQGVIAHEFSHIVHGDIRINIRLVGVIHGMVVIGLIGERMMQAPEWMVARSDLKDLSVVRGFLIAVLIMILGLFVVLIGLVGTAMGRLLQAAVSRQREFLADAAAVDYTRYPDGIASALRKISGLRPSNRLRVSRVSEFAHFMFTNGCSSWFATHPPIERRVARLEGVDPESLGKLPGHAARSVFDLTNPLAAIGFLGGSRSVSLDRAQVLLETIPVRLRAAVQNEFGARAAVLALLLQEEESHHGTQMTLIKTDLGPDMEKEVRLLHAYTATMDRVRRLVVIDICLPAISRLDREQCLIFSSVVTRCMKVDGRTDLFEWLLGRMVVRRLDARIMLAPVSEGTLGLRSVSASASITIAGVARRGASTEQAARDAFTAAVSHLGIDQSMPEGSEITLSRLGTALDELAEATLDVKGRILEAILVACWHDDRIRPEEFEMVRAVADGLGIRMPLQILDGLAQGDGSGG